MLYKPISTNHSPAHSHPHTPCRKLVAAPEDISDSRASSSFSKFSKWCHRKYSSSSENFSRWVNHQKNAQLSPFQTSFASNSKENNKPCCCRLPKFSIDVSRNKSAIQLQPADIIGSESSISSKTRKSLRHQSFLPIPAHQPIKGIYHGVSSGQTTVLFVAS